MRKVYISGALRTPLGIYQGSLAGFSEQKLAAMTMLGLIEKTGVDPAVIDEIVIGNSKQTSTPSNLARHAMLEAGLPVKIPAYTVQRQSASGLQAVINGYLSIKSDNADVVLAGGSESMSQIPLEIRNARYAFGADTEIIFDPIANQLAGAQPQAAYGKLTIEAITENITRKRGIAAAAVEAYLVGAAKKEAKTNTAILPVVVKKKKAVETVAKDQCYAEVLAIAKPADGAAVCLLCSEDTAIKQGLPVAGELLGIAFEAGSPACAGIFTKSLISRALEKSGLLLADLDYIEITEFSAAQIVAAKKVLGELGMTEQDMEAKVNSSGGTLATGLAWGACGAVMLTDLLDKLQTEKQNYGMVIAPAEGGQTLVVVVKAANR